MGGKYAAWEAGEITPEAVLAHKAPTEGFLCPLAANKYGIDFREFEIKDYDKVSSSASGTCASSGLAAQCGVNACAHVCAGVRTPAAPAPPLLLPLSCSRADGALDPIRRPGCAPRPHHAGTLPLPRDASGGCACHRRHAGARAHGRPGALYPVHISEGLLRHGDDKGAPAALAPERCSQLWRRFRPGEEPPADDARPPHAHARTRAPPRCRRASCFPWGPSPCPACA